MIKDHQKLKDADLGRSVNAQVAHVASYAKLAIPLILRMNKLLISQLAQIDKMLMYWRHAEEHWVHYMLHKSPEKFLEDEQFDEAQRNVKALERMKMRRYNLFGKLLVHLSTFSSKAEPKLQSEWLRGLFETLISSLPKQTLPPHGTDLSVPFEKAARVVSSFHSSFEKAVASYEIPAWYRRYWLGTSGGLLTLLGLAKLGYRHKEKIERGVQAGTAYVRDFHNKVNDIYEQERKQGEELSKRKAQLTQNYEKTLSSLLPFFTTDETQRRQYIQSGLSFSLQNREWKLDESISEPLEEGLLRQLVRDGKYDESSLKKVPGVGEKDVYEIIYKSLFNEVGNQNRTQGGHDIEKKIENDARLKRLAQDNTRRKDLSIVMKEIAEKKEFDPEKLKILQGLSADCDVLDTVFTGIHGGHIPPAKKVLNTLEPHRVQQFNSNAISEASNDISLSYVNEVPNELMLEVLTKEAGIIADRLNDFIDTIKEQDGTKAQLLGLYIPLLKNTGKSDASDLVVKLTQLGDALVDCVNTLGKEGELVALQTNVGIWKSQNELHQLWVSYRLLLLGVVAAFAIWPVYKGVGLSWDLFKWYRGTKNYEEVRGALLGLLNLFIRYGDAHPTEMEPEDVGRIHYLTYKLELEGPEVPKTHRKEFMQDVRQLQSQDLTPQQKYKIISDVIMNKYLFLKVEATA